MNSRSRRKYATEFIYLPTVHIDWISRPQELAELQRVDFERPPHLYFITSRPFITMDPDSVFIDSESIQGKIRIPTRDTFVEHEINVQHDFGPDNRIEIPWPHDKFHVFDISGDEVGGGVVANLAMITTEAPDFSVVDFDVLYVGQAYGKDGERIAPDRLSSHSTLQKALADCPRDRQIWLMVASISDEQLLIDIDGKVVPTTSDEEDEEHRSRVIEIIDNPNFKESEAISIAEAGLIRYFQPRYNETFKNAFPGPQYKMLETLRKLDLLGLIVELQGFDIPVSLGSEKVKSWIYHEAKYYVHLDGPDRTSDWTMRDWLEPNDMKSPAVPMPSGDV